MLDLSREKPLTPKAALRHPGLLNSRGKPAALSKFYRVIQDGIQTRYGRVRLESVKTPAGFRTTAEAIDRFIAALTRASAPADAPIRRRDPAVDLARAEAELELAGI